MLNYTIDGWSFSGGCGQCVAGNGEVVEFGSAC